MNWVLFCIHAGIYIACILYLLLKKQKRSVFMLLSVIFLAIALMGKVLMIVRSEWLVPSGQWEIADNMANVASTLGFFNTLFLLALTIYYVKLHKKPSNKDL